MLTSRRALLLLLLFLALAGCREATPAATPTGAPPVGVTPTADPYAAAREAMVREQIEQRGITGGRVLAALRAVPRHRFVPEEHIARAYADHPLPIGYGQTISQPYIVALMSQELGVQPGDAVLEIGTGSGYQAAVLAEMGVDVYTVEIIPELAQRGAETLAALGYADVHTLQADGYFGWETHAPYDAIIVTAAPDHLPQPLIGQLAAGGRLVIPIGPPGSYQTLWRYEKGADGEVIATNLGGVSFVPFTRAQ
ncbi:MAG: protein-L-isoaspartate(D-aspartate) O-methyltransferase [Chloroflexi bacterium]|nr:protein-L-isoaspartate(D-aspartate) O-methyltransferase [Chloroflexota bacterium]